LIAVSNIPCVPLSRVISPFHHAAPLLRLRRPADDAP